MCKARLEASSDRKSFDLRKELNASTHRCAGRLRALFELLKSFCLHQIELEFILLNSVALEN